MYKGRNSEIMQVVYRQRYKQIKEIIKSERAVEV